MLQEKKRAAKRSELFLCICGLCAALKSAASSAGIWLLLLLMRRSRKKSFSVRLLPHQRQLPHPQHKLAGRGCSLLLEGFYCEAACR